MMPWHYEFFRGSKRASEENQISANFRIWVGLFGYCMANLLCWGVIWGNYLATLFLALIWGITLPAVTAVALLVLKLKSRKATYTRGAYAATVITLFLAGWMNWAAAQNILGAP